MQRKLQKLRKFTRNVSKLVIRKMPETTRRPVHQTKTTHSNSKDVFLVSTYTEKMLKVVVHEHRT
jgi:hypothetical protein